MSEETNTLHNGRQRLRPWLVNQINEGNIKGLVWMNAEKNMFKIPWKHAGKQDYDPEEDSKIFKVTYLSFFFLELKKKMNVSLS